MDPNASNPTAAESEVTAGASVLAEESNGRERLLPRDEWPNFDDLVLEDGKPLDSFFLEKQQRLLTEPLYSSWPGPGEGRPFVVAADVGLFYSLAEPCLVPDVMLSLDVTVKDQSIKENRSYLVFVIGKVPEVVIEIVSDRRGGEDGHKLRTYARWGIPYYVIFNPVEHLKAGVLRAFELHVGTYQSRESLWFPSVGLGLQLWQGKFEGVEQEWLRWSTQDGQVVPMGKENAEQERQRAEQERQRVERLEAQLRALGIDPSA
jgi:Uma2 family endonuclease